MAAKLKAGKIGDLRRRRRRPICPCLLTTDTGVCGRGGSIRDLLYMLL